MKKIWKKSKKHSRNLSKRNCRMFSWCCNSIVTSPYGYHGMSPHIAKPAKCTLRWSVNSFICKVILPFPNVWINIASFLYIIKCNVFFPCWEDFTFSCPFVSIIGFWCFIKLLCNIFSILYDKRAYNGQLIHGAPASICSIRKSIFHQSNYFKKFLQSPSVNMLHYDVCPVFWLELIFR